MIKRRYVSVIAAGLALAMGAPVHAAGDKAAGKVKFDTCTGCHSIPGYYNVYPSYRVPRIAGQNEAYIVEALKGYKNGSRPHKTMQSQAASLSDQDMADIATYVSSLGK
ncbi:MAG: c-type cytochrome [Gammaproteobacteria bacterium]